MHLLYNNADHKVALADLKKRIVAFLIDILLLFSVIVLLDYYTVSSDETTLLFKPESILYILLGWLYFAGTETCPCMATLGKYLLGIKVKSSDKSRLAFKNASIRYFAKPVSAAVLIFRFITGHAHDVRRPYHDRIAGAQVVAE